MSVILKQLFLLVGAFCYKGKFTFFKSTQKDGYSDTQHDYILWKKFLTLI
jgi:uncharacterized iron-regulated protein